jgi:hypothetical protein
MLLWLILTNHCALGLMRPVAKAKVEHSCCHRGSHEPAKEAPEGPRQCCKDIKAALTMADAKSHLAAAEYDFPLILAFTVERFETGVIASREHGPPTTALSFAELVLQRSLLSHAPPVSA